MNVAVFGLGKLGCPLAAVLASRGHTVYGVDNNSRTVDIIRSGGCPVDETGLESLLCSNSITASEDAQEAVENSEIIFIVVPTPSLPDGSFSSEYVVGAAEAIGPYLGSGKLVVLVSTVMPGDTLDRLVPALERTHSCGGMLSRDFGVVYNPEFIALGSVIRNMLNPDFILIGESDKQSGDRLEEFYKTVVSHNPPFARMNPVSAEIAKLSLNCYLTTKISYANMVGELCDRIPEADVFKVLSAVGLDKRIGAKYLCAGTAAGGPCFSRDNRAFIRCANGVGCNLDLAEATQRINQRQTARILAVFRDQFLTGVQVAVLGMSYKCGTNVTEESAGVALTRLLASDGYSVISYDPLVKSTHDSLATCLRACDVAVVMLPYSEFSYLPPEATGKVVIDPWGIVENDDVDLVRLGVG